MEVRGRSSGVILAAMGLLNTSGNAAAFGAADLDLAVASYAFRVTSLGSLSSGSPSVGLRRSPAGWCCPRASSVVGLAGGGSPAGLGFVVARFFWTSEFWLLPYAAFWIWMIIICIQLIRKPGKTLSAADERSGQGGERP